MDWGKKAIGAVEEAPGIVAGIKDLLHGQRQWVLRYKWGNHPAESGLILASTRDKAEEVGRAWCLKKGAGQMQAIRFIGVEDPILADESILEGQ